MEFVAGNGTHFKSLCHHLGVQMGAADSLDNPRILYAAKARLDRKSNQFDPGTMAGGRRKPVVTCQQNGVQRFGQGDINGVIRGDIVAQRPNARQQKIMRVALHAKIAEIVECRAPAFGIDLASCCIFADDLCYFDVEQVRRVQGLRGREEMAFHCG